MNEKTKYLISLGASVAANCLPCFEHFYRKAESAGIESKEVQEVVEIAEKVKNGAGIATKNFICDIMENEMPIKNKKINTPSCCG